MGPITNYEIDKLLARAESAEREVDRFKKERDEALKTIEQLKDQIKHRAINARKAHFRNR